MINRKEQYVIGWLYDDGTWCICCTTNTYDGAIKTINNVKRNGQEYKYRIIKQIIQEEVVYDEL